MRLRCRFGRHEWGLWQRDTTQVPVMKYTFGGTFAQAGWSYVPMEGPSYRYCAHCPALERKV